MSHRSSIFPSSLLPYAELPLSLIDSDYQGEIKVHLKNESREYQTIYGNEKFIQFILMHTPQAYIIEVPTDQLYDIETNRGEGGFGSTDNIYTGC